MSKKEKEPQVKTEIRTLPTEFLTSPPSFSKSWKSIFGSRKGVIQSTSDAFDLYPNYAFVKPSKVPLKRIMPKSLRFAPEAKNEEEEEEEEEGEEDEEKKYRFAKKRRKVGRGRGKKKVIPTVSPSEEQKRVLRTILSHQPTDTWDSNEDPERYAKPIATLPTIHLSKSLNDLSKLGVSALPDPTSNLNLVLPDLTEIYQTDQLSGTSKSESSELLGLMDQYSLIGNKEKLIERELENLPIIEEDGKENRPETQVRFLLGNKVKLSKDQKKLKKDQIKKSLRKDVKFSIPPKEKSIFQSTLNLRDRSKEFWMDDKFVDTCYRCETNFNVFTRKHHCRICGQIYCWKCASTYVDGTEFKYKGQIRICLFCVELHKKKISHSVQRKEKKYKSEEEEEENGENGEKKDEKNKKNKKNKNKNEEENEGEEETDDEDNDNNNSNKNNKNNNNNNNDSKEEEEEEEEEDQHNTTEVKTEHVERIIDNDNDKKKSTRLILTNTLNKQGFSYFKDHQKKHNEENGVEKDYEFVDNPTSSNTNSLNLKENNGKKDEETETETEEEEEETESDILEDLETLVKTIPEEEEENEDENDDNNNNNNNEKKMKKKIKKNKKIDLKHIEIEGNNISIEEFIINYEKHIESIDNICVKHLQKTIRQLLKDNEIKKNKDEWFQIITGLVLKTVNKVTVSPSDGDKMDIRNYIKIKVLPGGSIYETEYFPGIVFSKHVVKKTMETDLSNPKILMLRAALSYEGSRHIQHSSLRRIDLEILVKQEQQYLNLLVKRLVQDKPNILLMENCCNGYALDLLEKEGVSVLTNVKKDILRKIGRCNNMPVFLSMHEIDIGKTIGRCEKTFLRKVEVEEEDFFFEDKNITVKSHHLNNNNNKQLQKKIEKLKNRKRKIRRKEKFLFFVKSTKPEKGCTILLRGSNRQELLKIKKIIKFALFAAHHLKTECEVFFDSGGTYSDSNYNNNEEIMEEEENKNKNSNNNNNNNDNEEEEEGEDDEDEDDGKEKKILSISPDVSFTPPTNLINKPKLYSRIMSPLMHQNIVLLFQSVLTDTNKTSQLKNKNIGSNFSQSKYVQPEIIIVAYYTENDMSVGRYLQSKCFSTQSVQKYINKKRCYVHGNGKVSVSVSKIGLEFMKEFGNNNNNNNNNLNKKMKKLKKDKKKINTNYTCFPYNTIFTWSFCKKCNKYVMPVRPISSSNFKLSFGKFLETSYYNHKLRCRGIGGCRHIIHLHHIKYFGFKNVIAKFEYEPIDVFEVVVPQIETSFNEKYNNKCFGVWKDQNRGALEEFLRTLVQMQDDEENVFNLSRKHKEWVTEFDHQVNMSEMNLFLKKVQEELQEYISDIMKDQLGIKKFTKSLHMLVRKFQKENRVIRCILKPDPLENDSILVELVIKEIRNRLIIPNFLHRKYYNDETVSGKENNVPVIFNDPSSMIAHTLSSKKYKNEVINEIQSGNSKNKKEPEILLKSTSENYHFEMEKDFSTRKNGFQIICYFSKQFATLRNMYLSDNDKKDSNNNKFIESMLSGNLWKPTGGKSRSVFFKTWDNRFVLKTLQHVEMSSFLNTAHKYFDYLSSALFRGLPTCLTKIFGCYKILWYCKGKLHKAEMMVMENLFYNRNISVSYDLKGSMRNRYVGSRKARLSQQSMTTNKKTLLDENLVEQILKGNPFVTKEHCKERLSRSIHNDSLFLSKYNIMDYSLLTGVDPDNKQFVVGIVDYLRQYSWDKHLETWIKTSFDYTASVPTVISPKNYKIRFREAIEKYFILSPSKFSGLLE